MGNILLIFMLKVNLGNLIFFSLFLGLTKKKVWMLCGKITEIMKFSKNEHSTMSRQSLLLTFDRLYLTAFNTSLFGCPAVG